MRLADIASFIECGLHLAAQRGVASHHISWVSAADLRAVDASVLGYMCMCIFLLYMYMCIFLHTHARTHARTQTHPYTPNPPHR